MSVKVVSKDNLYTKDLFKVKCPYCGSEIQYLRKDVIAHRLWPNGYIDCPSCENHLAHDENNLIMKGEEAFLETAKSKGKILTQDEEDQLKREISKYTIIRKIMVFSAIGILGIETIFTILFMMKTFAIDGLSFTLYLFPFTFLAFSMILVGSIVFGTLAGRRETLIKYSNTLEDDMKK